MKNGSPLLIGLPGLTVDQETERLIRELQPAGYILFSRNISSPKQLRELTDELRQLSYETPIIAIDQEGGRVTRTKDIGAVPPSAGQLASHASPAEIADAAHWSGEMLSLLGVNFNCAPVLDIDFGGKTSNALNDRCFGNDSQSVISRAGIFNYHQRRLKIRTCGKHFPGSGRAAVDPHFDLPVVDTDIETLLAHDLLPFTTMAPELDAIMTGHLNFPQIDPLYPSSLSPAIVQRLLRDQLGYEGLAITDDLDMQAITDQYGLAQAAKLAIQAGNDLAMVCHSFEEMREVAETLDTLTPDERIDGEKRVAKFRKSLPSPPDFSEKKWKLVNEKIFQLRVDVLGEKEARAPLSDGTSPVEKY